ncbi:RrF2 family transcriptional regulator [Arachidicoccus soli]|uniref:Rrf2 family transcriptional regulator n=1 Tax=Arachidicoccus soli TaxID=2341117 RepID=A0A386HKV9_9BACT|nr:Rrf2 family transcriptional regulator [Arachidicoccus soli]AYD46528.1 Rrf2 family transcriptional regulator [Arachidicoccus soli]
MNNVQFATYLHILVLLELNEGSLLSSSYISESININAAIVRKAVGELRQAGLVESKEGKGGGTRLSKAAKEILLSDIYKVINGVSILGKTNSPNPKCPIGKQINSHIIHLYSETEKSLVNHLQKITLEEFAGQFI